MRFLLFLGIAAAALVLAACGRSGVGRDGGCFEDPRCPAGTCLCDATPSPAVCCAAGQTCLEDNPGGTSLKRGCCPEACTDGTSCLGWTCVKHAWCPTTQACGGRCCTRLCVDGRCPE